MVGNCNMASEKKKGKSKPQISAVFSKSQEAIDKCHMVLIPTNRAWDGPVYSINAPPCFLNHVSGGQVIFFEERKENWKNWRKISWI